MMRKICCALVLVFVLQPVWAETQQIGEKEAISCVLYVTAYECASCRMSFIDFAKQNAGIGNVEYKVAIRFQRRKEFRQFIDNQADKEYFMEADSLFSRKYPQMKNGDIVWVNKGAIEARTTVYDNTAVQNDSSCIMKPANTV